MYTPGHDGLDPDERAELALEDLVLADLLTEYVRRRTIRETPAVHDLLATAHEFGADAVRRLRTVIALYERFEHDAAH